MGEEGDTYQWTLINWYCPIYPKNKTEEFFFVKLFCLVLTYQEFYPFRNNLICWVIWNREQKNREQIFHAGLKYKLLQWG